MYTHWNYTEHFNTKTQHTRTERLTQQRIIYRIKLPPACVVRVSNPRTRGMLRRNNVVSHHGKNDDNVQLKWKDNPIIYGSAIYNNFYSDYDTRLLIRMRAQCRYNSNVKYIIKTRLYLSSVRR